MTQRALFEDIETKIANRPSEYGKPYLQRKYSEFRDRFFDGDRGNLPPIMEIGFSNTVRALGHCRSRIRIVNNVPELLSCEIMLSNAYDFTPKKLDEVLVHEMIHAYLYNSKDMADVKDSHGPRFQSWCNRINSMSDFHITITSDTPVTLNQGMANRIANDGTVLLVAKNYKYGESAVIRVAEDNLQWAVPRAEKWLNKPVVPYACSDANFKKGLTLCRTRLTASIVPNSTIDDMVEGGIMKEIQLPDLRKPQDAVLLAWHWYRDQVAFGLVKPAYVDEMLSRVKVMERNHGFDESVSKYTLNSYFEPWDQAPVAGGKISSFKLLPKDEFNKFVTDGTITFVSEL